MLRAQGEEATSTPSGKRQLRKAEQSCLPSEKPSGDDARALVPCAAGGLTGVRVAGYSTWLQILENQPGHRMSFVVGVELDCAGCSRCRLK